MPPYQDLGFRSATGASDTSGNSGQTIGNWTVTFDPHTLNVTPDQGQFEIWHMTVTGASSKATFSVFRNTGCFSRNVYGVANEWDPQQPMVCRPGDYVFFYYSTPATDGFQPSVTVWLRHDRALDSGLFRDPERH